MFLLQSPVRLLPEQASTISGEVDALYFYLWGVSAVMTLLVAIVAAFFVIKYRRRAPDEIPRQIAGSMKLETLWSVIPFIIMLTFFGWGLKLYFTMYRMPKDAMEISVVGKQWMWKFQHPTGQREINELHVPIGQKIKLIMTTEDVIHALSIPDFRIKSDVVPGRYTAIWFEATKTGRYHLFCTEYCGTNHSGMGGFVEVMERNEYEAWLSGNLNAVSPIVAGEGHFNSLGCVSCHSAGGAGGRCPTLAGIFGKQQPLADGGNVTVDEAYIRESILNPSAKIVAGYSNIMPTYQGQVSEEQLLQLVSYIKSLSPAASNGIQTTAPARENNPSTGVASPSGQGTTNPDSLRSNPLAPTNPNAEAGRGAGSTRANDAASPGSSRPNSSSSGGNQPRRENQ
ncbi:MAG: cytochrome c oxidase subunit II [Pyrinomonadaceae bacterium]|nr:cytochrome c oxidase subunit II [Pyrinomonadaceae bacterium]